MAKITIAHKPGLTTDEARGIFSAHFSEKYRVTRYKGPFQDAVMIEKNPFVAVAIKIQQQRDQTQLVWNAVTPRWWARAMLGMLVGPLLGRNLTAEVRGFIESASEFH